MLEYSHSGTNKKAVIHDSSANKNYDSTQKSVILGANGRVVSNPGEQRKELVESLLLLLQNSIDDILGGMNFVSKVDALENHVFQINKYIDSLKEASETILNTYPTDERDIPLQEISEICQVTKEGVDRVTPYLETIKTFGEDLNNIRSAIQTQIQTLFYEIQ